MTLKEQAKQSSLVKSETCEIDGNACFFSLLYTTTALLTTHTRASLTHALLTYYLRSLAAHTIRRKQMARSPVCSASGDQAEDLQIWLV